MLYKGNALFGICNSCLEVFFIRAIYIVKV